MDRLSPEARDAMAAYRDSLALSAARVDRSWAAIEARAGDDAMLDVDEDDVATPLPAARPTRNAVALGAAAIAVLAAAVAVLAVTPRLLDEGGAAAEPAAAPYGAATQDTRDVEVREPAAPAPRLPPAPPADAAALDPAPSAPPVLEPPPPSAPARPSVTPRPAPTKPTPREPAIDPPSAAETDPDLELTKRLVAEAALLRRARAALRDGDHGAALRAADEHRGLFPDGELIEEVALVRLQALCGAGRTTEARAAAQSFAQRHPGSPLAARAARACPDDPAK